MNLLKGVQVKTRANTEKKDYLWESPEGKKMGMKKRSDAVDWWGEIF